MELNQDLKLSINTTLIEYLNSKDYTIEEFVMLYCIENEKTDILRSFLEGRSSDQKLAIFQRFERKLLMSKLSNLEEFDLDNYIITEIGEELLSECSYHFDNIGVIISEVIETNSTDFIEKFLSLWPEGTRNRSGDYLRSNRQDIKSKFNTFFKKYKYSQEIVLKATKNYLNQQALSRYEFANAAHYFILKSGISKLANECENVLKGNTSEDDISQLTNQLM